MRLHVRARIAELQAEAEQQLQAERDGQRYSMNRQGTVNLLIEIITSPPEKATLHNPLCEVRYVGKEGRMVAAFPDKVRCIELLTKLLGWAEPTQINISVDPLQSLLSSIRASATMPQAKAYELPTKHPHERTIGLLSASPIQSLRARKGRSTSSPGGPAARA